LCLLVPRDRPEISPGLVRDIRQVTQKFQDVNAATVAGSVSMRKLRERTEQGAMGVHYIDEAFISELALAVVPERLKANFTSITRCSGESVGVNVHFFAASTASRSK
jgi:hypothetical protein